MVDLNILKENLELASIVKLEISGADLVAFADLIHRNTITEYEKKADEVYLTPAELRGILKVSLDTLCNWDKAGITKPVYIGRLKRYRKSDLDKTGRD